MYPEEDEVEWDRLEPRLLPAARLVLASVEGDQRSEPGINTRLLTREE